MNVTDFNSQPNVIEHVPVHYTGQQLADLYGVSEATVRNRWLKWLCKVAPEELLRSSDGYTELAYALYEEFAKVDKKERAAWVADAKSRYSAEWSSVGIIDGELMPEVVGSALALLQTNNSSINSELSAELASLEGFVDQLNGVDADFTQAELDSFKAAGMKRAIVRFKVEAQTEAETFNALRQRRLQGGQKS